MTARDDYLSGVQNYTPEIETVKGKDGKKYPAKRKPDKPKTSIFARNQREANQAIKTLESVADQIIPGGRGYNLLT